MSKNKIIDIDLEFEGIEFDERSIKQSTALKGRKRPDQSKRMQGENNPMYGKDHPNKGKDMPNISEKIKGKKKPADFGTKISKAKKGVPIEKLQGRSRPRQSALMSDPERNKGSESMRQRITCEYCGKDSNKTNYHRWHGQRCKFKPLITLE
jgi:hypothetical protein